MIAHVVNIVSAERIGPHRLRLNFDDGIIQEVDFAPFLSNSQHPDIRAYLEESRFADFHLEHGELVWGDYELCFPIMDLYVNRLEKYPSLEIAA